MKRTVCEYQSVEICSFQTEPRRIVSARFSCHPVCTCVDTLLPVNTAAAALTNALKDEQSEPGCFSEATSLHYPSESQRIVLCPHKRGGGGGASEAFDGADVNPFETAAWMEFPPLLPANQSPESTACLNTASDSKPTDVQALPEPSASAENNVLGRTPLIGEYRLINKRKLCLTG